MKVLFILENYYPNIGGVETLFKSLAEKLSGHGHTITVLTNRFDSALKKYENLNGVQIIRLNLKNRYLFTFFAAFKATQLAAKHDFIHTTSYNAGVPAWIASVLSRKKVIITFHEVWGKLWFKLPYINKLSALFHFLFEYMLLKLSFDKFIAVSEATRSALINAGVDERKVLRIYNGLDYSDYANTQVHNKSDEFQFCFFGRLGISKGINLILEAIELLVQETKQFKLTMIVPTQPASFLHKVINTIRSKSLDPYIEIKHELSFNELKNTITHSDTVLIPSYSEGFCYAAVESIALGTAVISSGQGSLKEVVSGPHIHFEDLNALSLKEAMMNALNNKWQHTELKRFELDHSVEAYEMLYNKMVSE